MGFFRRLLGGGSDDATDDDPRAALQNAADERALRRLGVRWRAEFRHGGPLHAEFRAAVAAKAAAPATPPAAVHVVLWEDLGEPTVRDVVDLAAVTEAPFVLLRAHDPRAQSGAYGELEALLELEGDDGVALVLVGDLDLLLRRTFLLDLLAAGDAPDTLEVIPDLSDLAVARGLEARFVPA